MLLAVALRRLLGGAADKFLQLIYFSIGLDQELAIGVAFFDLGIILVGVHTFHRCPALLSSFELLFDRAVDRTLLRQPDAIKVGPRVKFTVGLAKQSFSELTPMLP